MHYKHLTSLVLCLKCKIPTLTFLTYVGERKEYTIYSGECTTCKKVSNMFFTPREYEALKAKQLTIPFKEKEVPNVTHSS